MHASPLGISSWLRLRWLLGGLLSQSWLVWAHLGEGVLLRGQRFLEIIQMLTVLRLPVITCGPSTCPALQRSRGHGQESECADWQAVAGDCISSRNQTWEPPSPWGKQWNPSDRLNIPEVFTSLLVQTEVSRSLLRDSQKDPLMSLDSTLTNLKYYSLWILGDLHVEFENYNESMQSAFLVIQSDSRHKIHPVTCGYAAIIHLPAELSNWMHRFCPIHLHRWSLLGSGGNDGRHASHMIPERVVRAGREAS